MNKGFVKKLSVQFLGWNPLINKNNTKKGVVIKLVVEGFFIFYSATYPLFTANKRYRFMIERGNNLRQIHLMNLMILLDKYARKYDEELYGLPIRQIIPKRAMLKIIRKWLKENYR